MRLPSMLFVSLTIPHFGLAQIETAPVEGLRENTPRLHVLRGATIWTDPERSIEDGTIVLRDGMIEKIGGADLDVPGNAREWDFSGQVIYAGFIDAASTLGTPVTVSKTNTHWNSLVRPERRAAEFTKPSEEDAAVLRNLGFAAAHVIPDKGVFRGQSSVINLGDPVSVMAADVRQCIAFETTSGSYPASLMGAVALVRQALYDARWYRDMTNFRRDHPGAERPDSNTALAALAPVVEKRQPLLARAGDELDYARVLRIVDEFELKDAAFLGNGREYRQADRLRRSGATVIVPLDFPDAPPVENPDAALEISLEKLEHWERAPANAAALAAKEIPICLTTWKLDKPKDDFWKNVRESVKHGLAPAAALAALTQHPAAMLGLSGRLGTIEPGKIANLVVASGDLFADEDAAVHMIWVDGRPFRTEAAKRIDLRGVWALQWNGVEAASSWEVKGKLAAPDLKIGESVSPVRSEGEKVFIYPAAGFFAEGMEGTARLTGYVNREDRTVRGTGHLPGGRSFAWSASISPLNGGEGKEDEGTEKEGAVALDAFSKYPAGAFGITGLPAQPPAVLIKNATIWTSAAAGRLENADMLVRDGKIVKIGENLPAPPGKNALIVEAAGKHVTAGLIDCHSHSAISRGINENTHSVTVEARVGDVVDPTDIALYRELAGGLTTSNLLHGSANPMGGQNQVIKLRWGARGADGLRFAGAMPGVKFALGENVKQSNSDEKTNRYPQTRMGVEQIMKDTFLAARDYEKDRADAKAEGRPHRRDLRLEAALEILNRERLVHIHSYRQDEILMFVRLTQELGFEVGTFQHVLEGYKVADAIAEIGAGGSSFSDWWAYKFEVYDAIPYNGALLHEAGVVTSFNSDSNELATRLNTEAAKAVKYGGLSEEEALKFVTINPAKQLRIESRVGSLEPEKDADFVIWSAPPLSSFARAEQTWIDGRKYFDIESDARLVEDALAERERLVAKALPERMKSLAKSKAKKELDNESETGEGRPGFRSYLQRDRDLQCLSAEQGLYHDGQDTHTCTSSGCCVNR